MEDEAEEGQQGPKAPGSDTALLCGHTDDPGFVLSARRLVARQYRAESYVSDADIDETGVLRPEVDPYHPTSTYFVAVDPESRTVVATIRQIEYDHSTGPTSFPMISNLVLSDEARGPLYETDPATWVELSGLAKETWVSTDIVNRLYREMWARSFAEGHSHWLIAADSRLARRLKGIFLSSMVEAGPPTDYLGSPTVPLYMEVSKGVDGLCERYRMTSSPLAKRRCLETARYFLTGMNPEHFSLTQIETFTEMGIDFVIDLREGALPVVEDRSPGR